MKSLKAVCLLLLLSSSSIATAVSSLGAYSGESSAFFDLTQDAGALSNYRYRRLVSVATDSGFSHSNSFESHTKSSASIDFDTSAIARGNIFILNNSNFDYSLLSGIPDLASTTGANVNANGPKYDNHRSKINLLENANSNDASRMSTASYSISGTERWVMIIVGLFLVAMQVIKAKSNDEPLGLTKA